MTAYLLNFATWPDASPLSAKYGMYDEPAEVCNHFYKGTLYRDEILLRIKRTLETIAAQKRGQ